MKAYGRKMFVDIAYFQIFVLLVAMVFGTV